MCLQIRRYIIFAALYIFVGASGVFDAALAQTKANAQPLVDRIARLERDLRALNILMSQTGTVDINSSSAISNSRAPGSAARHTVRLDAFESDLRLLTGSIEDLSHKIFLISERFDKLVSDVDFRLSAIEKMTQRFDGELKKFEEERLLNSQISKPVDGSGAANARIPNLGASGQQSLGTLTTRDLARHSSLGNGKEQNNEVFKSSSKNGAVLGGMEDGQLNKTTTGFSPSKVSTQATASNNSQLLAKTLPAGTPDEQYMFAFSLLQQAKYEEAEAALRAFIDKHDDNKLAGNARYWLGETYYVRGAYLQAAQTFLASFELGSNGVKGPDSLLKLGMSLAALGKVKEACEAFEKLVQEYPDAPSELKRSLDRETVKHGCA